MTAFIATDSRAERSAYGLNMRESSRVNVFPALPDGILNRFLFQCTISACSYSI